MIMKGSQRGGGLKLAAHLLNMEENDHVELHELRGFSADDLRGALREADAVSRGTKCRQFLFSLSLNPPETEQVSVAAFLDAIDRAEERLGFAGQPRAVVFHEKEGRRHAHVVWSRIDVAKMTAINLPFYKTRLNTLSKELFLEHGWRLPDGYRDRTMRNPLNFTLPEWQQAKRTRQDPQALKMQLRECWSVSDSRAGLQRALEDQGLVLARGDRRGFVAVDIRGEVYSLSRWTGVKTKALATKIGNDGDLPEVQAVRDRIAARMTDRLREFLRDADQKAEAARQRVMARKTALKAEQRLRRQALWDHQERRAQAEARTRQARFRRGIGGVWDWISGTTRKIRARNEAEAQMAARRDASEREALIARQLSARQVLQRDLRAVKRRAVQEAEDLRHDLAFYLDLRKTGAADDGGQAARSHRKSVRQQPER